MAIGKDVRVSVEIRTVAFIVLYIRCTGLYYRRNISSRCTTE